MIEQPPDRVLLLPPGRSAVPSNDPDQPGGVDLTAAVPVTDRDLEEIEREAEDLGVMTWEPTAAQLKKVGQPGRPSVIDNRVVAILVRERKKDRTITQACRAAGISRQAYYRAVDRSPAFAHLMEEAGDYLNQLADDVVKRSLKDGDSVTARWYKDKRDARYQPERSLAPNIGKQYNQFIIGDGRADRPKPGQQPSADSSAVDTLSR